MPKPLWPRITAHITETTGKPFQESHRRSVGGGCINQGYALSNGEQTYFVKVHPASPQAVLMFEAEALGLRQIQQTGTIRVPTPIVWGLAADSAYLVLEWLDLVQGQRQSWAEVGRQLAAMHRWSPQTPPTPPRFGWDQANTIGSTPQVNPWTDDWPTFFADHRIGYQLRLSTQRGGAFPKQHRLLAAIPTLLADHHPQPSIVHGDLWSGNAAVTQAGEPVIFDPAVYWGDREVDLAMTELFGGFPPEFYGGYREGWPVEQGYDRRKTLYNLYHILNHFNLFGGGYAHQANRMIDQLVA